MILLGTKRISYDSKRTGKHVTGYSLYCSEDLKDPNIVEGVSCYVDKSGKIPFISDDVAFSSGLNPDCIGKTIEFRYNQWGYISGLDFKK